MKDEKLIKKANPTWKLKHANSILETFEYFCQKSSKSISTILSYTVSKLVHFFRHSVKCSSQWLTKDYVLCLCRIPLIWYEKNPKWPQAMWFNRLHDITEFVEYETSRYTSAYAVHVFTLKRESVTTYQVSELSLHCTIWLIQEVSQLCVYCHSVSFYRHGIICYRWITDSLYHCPLSLCISPALLIARQWSNTRVKTWIFDARSSNAVSRDCCRLWSLCTEEEQATLIRDAAASKDLSRFLGIGNRHRNTIWPHMAGTNAEWCISPISATPVVSQNLCTNCT